MTHLQTRGYSDQKAGTIDPDLGRADTAFGREYREGMRIRRRDEYDATTRDGKEFAEDRTRPAPVPAVAVPPAVTCGAFAEPAPKAKNARKEKAPAQDQGDLFV